MMALSRLDNPHIVQLIGVQASRAARPGPRPAARRGWLRFLCGLRVDGALALTAAARGCLALQVDMHEQKVYVIMELCQGGELFDRIAECGGLDEADARRYFVQILSVRPHAGVGAPYRVAPCTGARRPRACLLASRLR
jgi:serine/threonine protein kinase